MKTLKSLWIDGSLAIALIIPVFSANPAVNWALTSETVVTSPADRKRVKVGVGEKVKITVPCSASWTITGGGELNPEAPATDKTSVTFTAPETAAAVTITATLSVDGSSNDLVFDVVEPDGLIFEKINNVTTANNPLGLLYKARFYITPADVNFEAIVVGENEVKAVTTV